MICRLVVSLLVALVACNDLEKTQFEAAFQGRCGRDSPCEQLCYELHDGMFECDCKEGFILSKNGYSCLELNTTMEPMLLQQEAEADIGEDILYQKDASFSAELDTGSNNEENVETTTGSSTSSSVSSVATSTITSTTVQAVQFVTSSPLSDVTSSPCTLECAAGGQCTLEAGVHRCQCPLGRSGQTCESEVEVRSPRFSGQGWLAFPALRAAYKHVQLQVEFRPESWDGILFLTGERDDLAGDFMVLFLYQGFVEFRFDCGSGVGVVRSEDNVLLNQWNKLTLYRHRWDAWIQLNNGKRVQGRSKGLFSRITFREPVFIGGRGNTSGITEKLPTERGFRGCVRHLEINDLIYNFALAPTGDAVKGFDIDECVADRCSKVPCQHGGKCLTSGDSAVCLCPLGFTGDLCETRLDLQVPSFNGSSYLRYPGLGGSALSWLDLLLVFKPSAGDGVILYNGHRTDGVGDFMSVYMSEGHLEFTFDLGTGAATLRSEEPVTLGQWHELRVSRTGRLAVLQVDKKPPTQILAPGAFTQLSLPLNLYIGGVPNFDMVSPKVKVRTSFVGCIQKVVINNQPLHILAEALAGVNVDNCPHPCVARPCGEHAHCVPHHEAYKCQCERHCQEVNAITTSSTASFTGTTFLHYTDPDIVHRIVGDKVSITLRFRTAASSGVLLWSGGGEQTKGAKGGGDYLALGLRDGLVHMRYNLGSGEAYLVLNSSRMDDGHWHHLKATRNGQESWLSVDNSETAYIRSPGKLKQLNTYTGLYVGGVEDMEVTTHHKYHRGLKGCISDLVLDSDYHVKLSWSSDSADHCG
ncbi:pikachurin isoform X2 [Macrosteles quadrilineatus]|uniref:pikachurin isoform X2 n=1 Tax=Macrosteles quadrilineatus TaxID=74068 RepID=UPI0023E33277|nr:pikachurin isoform X2 [Macrosteles quadrilineatus]